MEDRPETLLKSALEKIVYFEARSEQLANDLVASRAEAQRLREELASAAQREIELRRQSAELEVRITRAHADRDEVGRLYEALKLERTELIGKLLEASSIHASDQEQSDDAPLDLARFIAELRGAAIHPLPVQQKVVELPVAPVARAEVSGPASHALRLHAEGRLAVSTTQVLELSTQGAPFAGHSEETLFGFSVRELSAPDASARVRAAERLAALGHPAAAPALATALNAETEPRVQVALLEAFGRFNFPSGTAIVSPQLESKVPQVRVAALKALVALSAKDAGPHLAAALKDPDSAVRRRASLLALGLGGQAALQLGEQALRDSDAEVRSLAALVLGASGGEQARALLQSALRDPDKKVRAAAAQSLSRLVGEDLSCVVNMDEAQRRREARRISTLPLRPVKADAAPKAAALPQAPARVAPEALCASLLTEIRMAIRGRAVGELLQAAGGDAAAATEACELLVARGQVVKRGAKYFAA